MKRKELILVVAIALMAGIGIGLYLAKDAVLKSASSQDSSKDGIVSPAAQTPEEQEATLQRLEQARKERRKRRQAEAASEEVAEKSESAEGGEPKFGMDFSPDFGALMRNWLSEEGDSGRKPPKKDKDEVLEEVYKVLDKFRNGSEKERNDIKAGAAVLQVILTGMTQDIKNNPPEISVAKRQEILDGAADADEIFEALEDEMKDFDDEEKRVFGNTVKVLRSFTNAIKEAAEK